MCLSEFKFGYFLDKFLNTATLQTARVLCVVARQIERTKSKRLAVKKFKIVKGVQANRDAS